jgi:hypothetical protein
MGAFSNFISVISIPLGLLNTFGGIVAGVWLAILGEWGIIGYGVVILIFASFTLGLAMMPGLMFAIPAASMAERGNKIGSYLFNFLGSIYGGIVLTIWCVGLLYYFAHQANADSIVPILLWSYGVATGPIGWLTQKEIQSGGGGASVFANFFAQVAYVIVMISVLFFEASLLDAVTLYGTVMVIGTFFQFLAAIQLDRMHSQF